MVDSTLSGNLPIQASLWTSSDPERRFVFKVTLPATSLDNATLFVQGPGILNTLTCTAPSQISYGAGNGSNATSVTLTAALGTNSPNGQVNSTCVVNIPIDTPSVPRQAGVLSVDPVCNQYITSGSRSAASMNTDLVSDFRSVAFWLFDFNYGGSNGLGGKPQGTVVFCEPGIQTFNVEATIALPAYHITNVTILGDYGPSNNVTGAPLSGLAYNGYASDLPSVKSLPLTFNFRVSFSNSSSNKFTQQRAPVPAMALGDALVHMAGQAPNSVDGFIGNASAFHDAVQTLYVSHASYTFGSP